MTSRSTLTAAAADFLAETQPMAWHQPQRVTTLVRQFASGALDAAGLEAALDAEQRGGPRPASKKGTVAVLSLVGVLTPGESLFTMLGAGTSVRTFMRELAAADASPQVKAIVVVVDSPGGYIRQIPEAAQLMRAVRSRKPVLAAVMGLCASASYWIASNASAIEVTPSGDVGAIGIITQRISIAKQLAEDGIDVAVITAGKYKSEGHEATPISDVERAAMQALVDAAYTDFVNDVAAGRQTSAAIVRSGFGEGRVVVAKDALRLRMIDRIALVEDTIGRAASTPTERAAMLQGQRLELARAALSPFRHQQARVQLAEHRRELAAAARRGRVSIDV